MEAKDKSRTMMQISIIVEDGIAGCLSFFGISINKYPAK
jgi:hypothetical protein